MRNLFGRHKDAVAPDMTIGIGDKLSSDENVGIAGREAYLFVESQQEHLSAISNAWLNAITANARFESAESVQAVMDSLYKTADPEMVAEYKLELGQRAESDAARLTKDLAVFTYICLREASTSKKGNMRATRQLAKHLNGMHDPYIRNAGISLLFTNATSVEQLNSSFAQADEQSEIVLMGLIERQAANPNMLSEIADLYDEGLGEADWRFSELRRTIATDWWRPDAQNSKLRKYVKAISTSPELHYEDFINEVAGSSREDVRYRQIIEMALFAVAASGGKMDDAVRKCLLQTVDQWGDFPQIDEAFLKFVGERCKNLEADILEIAGSQQAVRKDIRLPRTQADIESSARPFIAYYGDRTERRKLRGNGAKGVAIPTIADFEAETVDILSKIEPQDRKIVLAKRVGNAVLPVVEETTADSVTEVLGKDRTEVFISDVMRMLEEVKSDPFGPGTKKLRSGNINLAKQSKTLRLRRFSPHERPGFAVQDETARSYRVVYGITKGEVIIVDILDHDRFDRKYR